MNVCDDCKTDYKGLYFLIPSDIWVQISPTKDINGKLCPWCADKRLKVLGIRTEAEISLKLPYLDGDSKTILPKFAEITHYKHAYNLKPHG